MDHFLPCGCAHEDGEEDDEEAGGVVAHEALSDVVEAGLPVVHDEVHAVPEGQAVAGEDDAPHDAAAKP